MLTRIVSREGYSMTKSIQDANKSRYLRCFNHVCSKRWNKRINRFKMCKGCKVVYYCGRICQKKHWKQSHNNECKDLATFRQDAQKRCDVYGKRFRSEFLNGL